MLGDYGKTIGTGILVQSLIQNNAHDVILKRIRRSANKKNTMDIANAVIVCDVILTIRNNEAPVDYGCLAYYTTPCKDRLSLSLHGVV